MNLEIYDALIQAKFPEKPARVLDDSRKKATITHKFLHSEYLQH